MIQIILLQILAAILLLAEIFLPSAGLLGFLTAGVLGWSLWLGFEQSISLGWLLACLDLIVFPLLGWKALGHVSASPLALQSSLQGTSSPDDWANWVGQEGPAETDLRPAGKILIADKHLDVVSDAGYIGRGTVVRVVRADQNRLLVRPAIED